MGKQKSKTTLPTEDLEASASESLLPGESTLSPLAIRALFAVYFSLLSCLLLT